MRVLRADISELERLAAIEEALVKAFDCDGFDVEALQGERWIIPLCKENEDELIFTVAISDLARELNRLLS